MTELSVSPSPTPQTTQSAHDDVRRSVSDAYTRAVENGEGCCDCCTPTTAVLPKADVVPKGVAVKSAGYAADELADLPADSVVNSFGCGNPLAFAGVEPGQTVLDLGSGAGIDLLLAARRVGPEGKVIGVDMTDAMIERARANVEAAGASQVEVRKGLIEELPVDDASVDWVISNCVINLSPDKEKVFREIARVLRPGGRVSVSDIVVEELPPEAGRSAELYCGCVGGAIPEAEYRAGLEAAGLADVEVADRLVYEAEQLRALVCSELGAETPAGVVQSVLPALEGKVASVRFTARRP